MGYMIFSFNKLNDDNYKSYNGNKQYAISFRSILIPILAFSFIAGIRYDVGTDHLAYMFGYVYKLDISKGEWLFQLLTEYCWRLNLHHTVYFGVLAFFNATFFFYAFKHESYILPLLAFFLFTNGDWLFWMNGIRQSIAMCIWIYALNYIVTKKILHYYFWCIVAVGFHWSALLLFLIYPLFTQGHDYFKNISLQLVLIFIAFTLQYNFELLLNIISPLINIYSSLIGGDLYQNYSIEVFKDDVLNVDSGTGLGYLFKLITNLMIILFSVQLKSFYNNKWFLLVYSLFFIGIFLLYIFPIGSIGLTRPFRYFYIFQCIMYAYLAYYLLKSGRNAILGLVLILLYLGMFYLSLITSNENSHILYQFSLNKF